MEIKVGKVELGVTNNGTVKAVLYPEGSDFNNTSEGIEIIGDECIYLATRKEGETVEIIEKGRWKNLVLPEDFQKALKSTSYDRVKLLFKRSTIGLNKAVNGNRTEIDLDVAKVLLVSNFELQLKVQNFILETLKNTDTPFAKQLVSDIGSKDINAQYNAWKMINDLANRNLSEIAKEYRVINDCVEPETVKKSKK